jgi:hypothetical protein
MKCALSASNSGRCFADINFNPAGSSRFIARLNLFNVFNTREPFDHQWTGDAAIFTLFHVEKPK